MQGIVQPEHPGEKDDSREPFKSGDIWWWASPYEGLNRRSATVDILSPSTPPATRLATIMAGDTLSRGPSSLGLKTCRDHHRS